MTTTGYGDIVPVDPFAGSLANLEVVIGPFYLAITVARLVTLPLPLIKNGAPARIVNVSSAGQQPIDFDDVMLTRGYSGTRAYCQSKLAQIMFTIDLGAALEGTGVTVTCLHPATYMDTSMVRRAGVRPLSTVRKARGRSSSRHIPRG